MTLESVVAVMAGRIALAVLPFRLILRISARRPRRAPSAHVSPEQLAERVTSFDGRFPRSTCLTRAIATSLLLRRYGYAATIHLGVARNGEHFGAHAWLESEGRAVVGKPGDFTPLA